MRTATAVVFVALAFWRATADWMATIGEGYAYRFATLRGLWPETLDGLAASLQASAPAWAWDPVGAFLLSLPVAPLLAAIGAGFWITRERRGTRARTRW